MQLASEASQSAPTENDAPSQAPGPITSPTQVQIDTSNLSNPSIFAATKAVKTLARYLDMCLMRQRELRRAVVYTKHYDQLFNENRDSLKIQRQHLASIDSHLINPLNEIRKNSTPYGLEQNRTYILNDCVTKDYLSTSHSSLQPKGTNCLHIVCCCGLFKWLGNKCKCKKRNLGTNYHYHMNEINDRIPIKGGKYSPSITDHNSNLGSKLTSTLGRNSIPELSNIITECSADDQVNLTTGTNCCLCLCSSKTKPLSNERDGKLPCCRYQGNFLVRLYLFVKLLYLCNVVGQIFLLEYYTGVKYNFYGIRVLYDLIRGRQWEESGHFPRVTFCDFEARKLAQSHYYTLQCVLPINMFLEKIYIFLWLWFFMVGFITLLSVLIWIFRLCTNNCRFVWIRHQLITIRQYNRDQTNFVQFVNNHLGPDGVFLLRLIAQNFGDLVAGDTLGELWTAYWQRRSVAPNQTGHTGLTGADQTVAQTTTTTTPTSGHVKKINKSMDKKMSSSGTNAPYTFNYLSPKAKLKQDYYNSNQAGSSRKHGSNRLGRHGPYPITSNIISNGRHDNPFFQGGHKKDKWKRTLSGFPSTLLATEMIHPIPLIAATRKPPSIPSRSSSSRHSNRERSRDNSESPPPIPQRFPGCSDYSFNDKQSIQDYGGFSESSMTSQHASLLRQDNYAENEYEIHSDHVENNDQNTQNNSFNQIDQIQDPEVDNDTYDDKCNNDFPNDDNIV